MADVRFLEYLDYDVALEIFKTYEIFHLKPLFVGRMNEALDYNLKFDSTLPKILGFPELPKGKRHIYSFRGKPDIRSTSKRVFR